MSIEIISPIDYGAVGDGVVNDTAAFQRIEQEKNQKFVDLLGKTYLTTVKFENNLYMNGSFKINDKVYDAPYKMPRAGNSNVFLGKNAGENNDSYFENSGGYNNVAIGEAAMQQNGSDPKKVGWRNVAIGHSAMRDNIVGYNNVAVGDAALERNIGKVLDAGGSPSADDYGCRNTGVGSYALRYNTTGIGNVGIGRNAAHANETGDYNTAIGTNAYSGTVSEGGQQDRKSASYNSAVGYGALFNTNADNNIGVGVRALYANKSGNHNIAVGNNATSTIEDGHRNTVIGNSALRALTSGSSNVGIGAESLRFLRNGSNNVALGEFALSKTIAGNNAIGFSNSVGLGANSSISGSDQIQIGNSNQTTYVYGSIQNRSDMRDKAEIRDTELGLDFIQKLRPVDFKWDYREDYDGAEKDGSKTRKRYHHGLIAQEVQALGEEFGGLQDHSVNGGEDVLSIGYSELIGPMVKAIQDLSSKIEDWETELSHGQNSTNETKDTLL